MPKKNSVGNMAHFFFFSHALESYTALPYNERSPRPKDPIERPAYQGSNPISDVWSLHALKMVVKYLPRATKDPEDFEAQSQMLLAATFAGIGFGNAGVHLCHGLSYPISGLNKNYKHPGYNVDHPIVVRIAYIMVHFILNVFSLSLTVYQLR